MTWENTNIHTLRALLFLFYLLLFMAKSLVSNYHCKFIAPHSRGIDMTQHFQLKKGNLFYGFLLLIYMSAVFWRAMKKVFWKDFLKVITSCSLCKQQKCEFMKMVMLCACILFIQSIDPFLQRNKWAALFIILSLNLSFCCG